MENEFFDLKVYKMGKKLGLVLNRSIMEKISFNKGEYIKINIKYNGKQEFFLSTFNNIITLRNIIIKKLNLKNNDIIKIKIEKADFLTRADNIFFENKIDILSLIPLKNRLGFNILVHEFKINNEIWLKIWYCFKRGSCKEIEIRRYIDILEFGKFLGLMQSEGTKENINVIEFCNKSIFEHIDFLNCLEEIGISREQVIGKFDYHPRIKNIQEIISNFEKITKIRINYIVPGPTSGGGYGFKVIFRSRLLTEIILNSLNTLRKLIKKESLDNRISILRDCFFSKLLNGDGNLEIIQENRNVPLLRLKISDGKLSYLKDYSEIMKVYNLEPKICAKYGFVRSYVNKDFALELVRMDAFKNNPNYFKLQTYLNLMNKIGK